MLPNSTYKTFGINYMNIITIYCTPKQEKQTKHKIEKNSLLKGQIITLIIPTIVPKIFMLHF